MGTLLGPGYKYNPDEDYTSPDVYKQRAEYARALLKGSQEPVKHWGTGVAHMLDALTGGMEMRKARQDLANTDKGYATSKANVGEGDTPNVSNPMGRASSGSGYAPPFPGAPARSDSSSEQSPALAEDRSQYFAELNDPHVRHTLFQRAANEDETDPSAFIQSAINRAAAEGKSVLQTINNPNFYPATSFKNKPYNKEAYDKALAAVQFGDNKLGYGTDNASENVGFGYGHGARDPRTYTSASGERYGVQNTPASKAYASSRASMDDAGPQVSQDQMVDRALALSGPDTPQRIAQALTRGTKAAPGAQPRTPYPDPAESKQYIDPRLIPKQRVPTREQMINILRHRGGNEAQDTILYNNYLNRGNPQRIDLGEYGTAIVNSDGSVQEMIPKVHEDKRDYKGFKPQVPYILEKGPNGPVMKRVQTENAGGQVVPAPPAPAEPELPNYQGRRSEAAPAAPAAPEPDIELPDYTGGKRSEAPPSMLSPGALPPQEAIAQIANNAVADLGDGDTTPEKIDVAALGNGSISDAPPPGAQRLAGPAQAPTPAPVQVAQAGKALPPGVSAEDAATMGWLDKQEAEKDLMTSESKKQGEQYVKDRDGLHDAAGAARTLLPELSNIRTYMNDPRFMWGPTSGVRKFAGSLMAERGLTKQYGMWDPSANEKFEKSNASALLTAMKEKLGGLGQVRLAEIFYLAKSLPSAEMTPESRTAILASIEKATKMVVEMDKVSDFYEKGYRLNPDGSWVRDARGKPVLDNSPKSASGLNSMLNNFLNSQKILTPDQEAAFHADQAATAKTKKGKEVGRQPGWAAEPPKINTRGPDQPPLP